MRVNPPASSGAARLPASPERPGPAGGDSVRPPWPSLVASAASVVLALVFLVSGSWKLVDLHATAERMVQVLVPLWLSGPAAFAVAIAETTTGILLVVPRYRRWGALAAALLLLVFMVYIGLMYDRLLGEDCSCFPWVQRVVGPSFFAGNVAMLSLAVLGGWLSPPSRGWRGPVVVACLVAVTAGSSYVAAAWMRRNVGVPEVATVRGDAFSLRDGRVLLYFFDPECTHCYTVARDMAQRDWGAVRLVVVPIREPQFAGVFLDDTGLRAAVSDDAELLRRTFAFSEPPFAVALDRGKAIATFNSAHLEDPSWYAALEGLGFVR
jgi:uncharacterized membrane protein YphA (DoxX/SURF4 family)